ncbi:hypothetical protein D3C87_1396370 [compost metagenome]
MQDDDGKHRCHACAGTDADNVRAGKRVAQHDLEGDTTQPEAQTRENGEQRAWQAQLPDRESDPGNVLSEQHPQDVTGRREGLSQHQRQYENRDQKS